MDNINTPRRQDSAYVCVRGYSKKGESGPIQDNYDTLEEVTKAIKDAGIEKCGLILGIDYTMSNIMQGKKTFGGRSLHSISDERMNPYQECICYLGETLEGLDDDPDGVTYAFGFGDKTVKDKDVFPLKTQGECHGFMEVLEAYAEITPKVKLSGPTNFAPLIYQALSIVRYTKKYHILVIIADGHVANEQETIASLVEASNYPLSIIMVGVGDGPWNIMESYDDKILGRKFDNFQFVDFHKVIADASNPQSALSLAALMEIPDQYKLIKKLCLLQNV